MNKILKGLVASFALAISGLANAGLIWDNGSFTTNQGGNCSDCGTYGWMVFDDFTLNSDTVISYLDFDAGFYDFSAGTTLNIGFWNSVNSGLISSQTFDLLTSSSTSSIENAFSGNWTTLVDIADLSLSAGTYYISIQGQSAGGYMTFSHSSDNGNGENAIQVDTGNNISYQREYDMPFRLYSVQEVPEPSTLAILALGLMGLASRKFKKQA